MYLTQGVVGWSWCDGVVSNSYPQRYCYLTSLITQGVPRHQVCFAWQCLVSRVGLFCATYALSPLTYASPYARLEVRVCDLQDTPTLHRVTPVKLGLTRLFYCLVVKERRDSDRLPPGGEYTID